MSIVKSGIKVYFTKMHGCGNDFIVLDGIHQTIDLTPEQCRTLANRHFGIGADQILVVETTNRSDVDFRYRIYNADGSEVEQCGNGARAFVKFVTDKGLTTKKSIRVQTLSGIISPSLQDDGRITVNMGKPAITPDSVPFQTTGLIAKICHHATLWALEITGQTRWLSVVSMGNPHAVQIVSDCARAAVTSEGPLIEQHARFPKRVNAGFMQVLNRHHLQLRVFERGAGETLSCGTGACAAAVCGILQGVVDSPVHVSTRGGDLTITWQGDEVEMIGPAVTIFEGTTVL